ncbi:sensor histidine kinase [Arthrobacter sp. Sr24]
MSQSTTATWLRRHFYERSLRVKVILSQAPLSLTFLLLMVHAAALYPQAYAHPSFMIGLWLHAAILALCFVVPWNRLPQSSFLVIPYLDFVAIGFMRDGTLDYATTAGLMVLFPAFWLSASGLARKTAVLFSALGTLLVAWVPLFLDPAPLTAQALGLPVLFPFMVGVFAFAVVGMTASMDSQRLKVESKDDQLRTALAESRQREKLLSTILNTVPVGLVVVDAQGHDSLMNETQRAAHALGIPEDVADPAEHELLLFGMDKVTPMAAEDRPVRRAVKGESFSDAGIWLGSGDQARAFSTTSRIMEDEDGNYDGAVVVFHDITDMTEALAAKDAFIASVSHEFRTPLTSILGYTGLLLEDESHLPAGAQSSLGIIERNAERLLSLVNDLLDTKTMEIHPAPADFSKLVAHSVAAATPAAIGNGVALRAEVQGPLPVLVDAVRISQVLDNLVSNAIKYTPDGGPVTVRAWTEGDALLCEVQDVGLGMSTTDQEKAFTKFFRSDQVLERSITGLGLGLVITKWIVEKHGGNISLQSEPGAGTTVRFALPGAVLESA